MNNQKINSQPRNPNNVTFGDLIYLALRHWTWVLLSLIICLGLAALYLLYTPNKYTQSASVLIKEDSKGKSANSGINDFSDLGLLTNTTNIENEISTFKSPDLMEEVVRRLNLDFNYYLPGAFHKEVAYGSSLPVNVSMPDIPDNSSVSFKLSVGPKGDLSLSEFRYINEGKESEIDKNYNGHLNDTIRTIAGPLVVVGNEYYQKESTINLKVEKIPLRSTINSYCANLSVKLDNQKGSVINLSIVDQNIQRADEVLSTLIGVYNENWIRDKNQIAVSTSNFINERLGVIEGELGNVDSDISSYKSANLVPDVNAAASSYMAESQQIGQELVGLNNQLQMTRYIRNYLSGEGNYDKVLPTNTGVDNLDIENQIALYNTKLLQRNNLVSKSSEKNPLVQNMDKELQEMRGSIIGSVDNSIINLQTQMKGLQGARGAATSKLASSPTQAKYLLSVERQQKVKESLYLFLLQKREDNELNQAFTAYNTRVIKRPGGSNQPTSPHRASIMLAALLAGCVLPLLVIYVKESNNTKVRGRKDVENLNLPMLGEIPQYVEKGNKKNDSKDRHEIVVKYHSRNVINEAFRVLRTNIEFSRVNKDGCNVYAITSFNPSSGKSFISVNLACALAIKEKRVLIIDGDLRHGSASAYFDKAKCGLSDYLTGDIDNVDSCLVTSDDFPTLRVLATGTIPPNPTELLESPRFEEMIENLRKDFDYIIIDCPPIEIVADAKIIDRVADRTIFVVRAGLLDRGMLSQLDIMNEDKKYKRMAFILNGTLSERSRYGYSHGYKYGYGYGYGYGYASEK